MERFAPGTTVIVRGFYNRHQGVYHAGFVGIVEKYDDRFHPAYVVRPIAGETPEAATWHPRSAERSESFGPGKGAWIGRADRVSLA